MQALVRVAAVSLAVPLLLLGGGCAHERVLSAAPASQEREARASLASNQRVVVTGSRIPQRGDPCDKLANGTQPVRVHCSQSVESTGWINNLGGALRSLDPSVSINAGRR